MKNLYAFLAAVGLVAVLLVASAVYVHFRGSETVATQVGGSAYAGRWLDEATGEPVEVEVQSNFLVLKHKGHRYPYHLDRDGRSFLEDGGDASNATHRLLIDEKGRLEWNQTNASAGSFKVQRFRRP